nr:AEL_HP1_G0051630.mRNA.1.CDS.1 [Saccharomyces cerevisiae]
MKTCRIGRTEDDEDEDFLEAYKIKRLNEIRKLRNVPNLEKFSTLTNLNTTKRLLWPVRERNMKVHKPMTMVKRMTVVSTYSFISR